MPFQVEKSDVGNTQELPIESTRQEEEEEKEERKEKKMKKGVETDAKKPKRERLEAFSKKLRLCIIKRVNHGRHRSSQP